MEQYIFFPPRRVKSCSENPRDTEVTAVNVTPILSVDEESQYSNSDSSEDVAEAIQSVTLDNTVRQLEQKDKRIKELMKQ
jgi:hypothetical protein